MDQNAVDFLPEDYVEKRAMQRSAVVFVGLFILVLGGTIGYYLFRLPVLKAEQAEAQRLDAILEQQSKHILEVQDMDREKQRMMAKAEVTAALLERVPRSVLLKEFTALMPKGTSLISLDLKSKEVAIRLPAGPPKPETKTDFVRPPTREVTVFLTGLAPTDEQVAAFIASLGKNPLLVEVNLAYSEEFKHAEQTLRRFRVEMKLNPLADVRTMTLHAKE